MAQRSPDRLRICRNLRIRRIFRTWLRSVVSDLHYTVERRQECRVGDSRYRNRRHGMGTPSTQRRDRRVHGSWDPRYRLYRMGIMRWIGERRRRRRWGRGGASLGFLEDDVAFVYHVCHSGFLAWAGCMGLECKIKLDPRCLYRRKRGLAWSRFTTTSFTNTKCPTTTHARITFALFSALLFSSLLSSSLPLPSTPVKSN